MSENLEGAADRLGEWLSSPRSAGHETTKLVELTNRLTNLLIEKGKALSDGEDSELVSEMADILAHYDVNLYPMRGEYAFPKSRQPVALRFVSKYPDTGSIQACENLNIIWVLIEHGELWRVKFCRNCGRYFRATRRRSAWCASPKCEEQWRKSDAQFKKKRADKAFEEYWAMQMEGRTGKALRETQARRAKRVEKREGKGDEKS
jgi:hypothetical protein